MVCQWCMEKMDNSAVVCPYCRRERKDFHQHKVLAYVFGSIFLMSVIYGIGAGKWLSSTTGQVELGNLLLTLVGWSAMVSCLLFVVCYVKASKIANSWWWH